MSNYNHILETLNVFALQVYVDASDQLLGSWAEVGEWVFGSGVSVTPC